jgi:hypothetical protein
MLNSENKYQVSISLNQRIGGIHLTLIDGTFEIIYTGQTDQLNLDLFQGIYKLKASLIDFNQEYILVVDEDKDFRFDFDYPSVAPILEFKTTHEYFHGNAAHYSTESTNREVIARPNFLFFAAKYDKELYPEVFIKNHITDYSIIDKNNKPIIQFDKENSEYSNEYGWVAFSTKIESGLYFLQWNDQEISRNFPFYIFDNYQTQFFIRYTRSADFDNCFFFYTDKMCFRQDAAEYLILEKIQYAYKDYKNYELLTEEDKLIIRQHPYLVTLIRILHQSLISNNHKFDDGEQMLISNCHEFDDWEHLPLPDLQFLSSSPTEENDDDHLPIISAVMTHFTYSPQKKGMTIKPASLIDRTIDHINFDLFWNNYSKIDNAVDWLDLYTKFVSKSDLFIIRKNDSEITKLGKKFANTMSKAGKDTIQERLDSLMGKEPSTNSERKIKDAIKSIRDVSQIAVKLNLPPTKVLRNYDTYKMIYDKLK